MIVNAVASELGGKGGGRPDSAMAGGTNPEKLPLIVQRLPELILGTL